jgi:hypothetical protein
MIRTLAILAALLAPLAAVAQDQPPASPETRGLGQMVMEAAQREASLRAQVFALQDEIARLKVQAKVAQTEAPRP